MNFAYAFPETMSHSDELNYATTAFELPDIMSEWRSAHHLPEADYFLKDEPPLSHIETLHTTLRQLTIENSILVKSYKDQKTRAEAAITDLTRLRDRTNAVESEFNRVRGRALDVILALNEEVSQLKMKPTTFKETVEARVASLKHR